jgi:hypothetical protein
MDGIENYLTEPGEHHLPIVDISFGFTWLLPFQMRIVIPQALAKIHSRVHSDRKRSIRELIFRDVKIERRFALYRGDFVRCTQPSLHLTRKPNSQDVDRAGALIRFPAFETFLA